MNWKMFCIVLAVVNGCFVAADIYTGHINWTTRMSLIVCIWMFVQAMGESK